jgi:hypothetical protein
VIANCPTSGNVTITLEGTDFGAEQAVVLVGGAICDRTEHAPTPLAHRKLTCVLPSGTGTERPVFVLQAGGGVGPAALNGVGAILSLSYVQCLPGTSVANLTCVPCGTGQFSDQASAPSCVRDAAPAFALLCLSLERS